MNRVQPVELKAAITAGRTSVNTDVLPSFDWNYISSCPWQRKCAVIPYTILHYGVCVIAKVVKYALLAIAALVYGIYWTLNKLTFDSLKHIYDYVCPINPINGEHQFVFPYVFEKFLIEYLFPQVARKEDEALTQMCRDAIGENKLLIHEDDGGPVTKSISWMYNECLCPTYGAKRQPDGEKFSYKVIVLPDEDEMNAFSTLGGEIYVNQGLLDKVDQYVDAGTVRGTVIPLPGGAEITLDLSGLNEEKQKLKKELKQMVFLHEACHSQLRHNALGLMFACVVKVVLAVVGFFFFEPSILKSIIDFYAAFRGRWNEHEADIAAAYFAKEAGINPLTAIYFQALSLHVHRGEDREREGDRNLKWFSSHPPENERKRALYAAMETFANEELKAANPQIKLRTRPYPFDKERSSEGVKWVLEEMGK